MNTLPWIIWLISALFVVFKGIHLVFFDVAATDLAKSLNANEEMLSSIAAAYFYTYAALQIPVGIIIDRFNAKTPLTIAISCSIIGTCLFAMTSNPIHALLYRMLMGAGVAFCFIGCLKLTQEWFPPKRFSTMAGLTGTATTLGPACGLPIEWSINTYGWREVMLSIGAAQFVLLTLFIIFTKEPKVVATIDLKTNPNQENKNLIGSLFEMLCNSQVILNAIYAAGMCLIFGAFGGLWGSTYIIKHFNIDNIHAASVGSFLFLGATMGTLFFGWFSDAIKSRKKPMLIASLLGAIGLYTIIYCDNLPLLAFELILFLTGFMTGAYIISYTFAKEIYSTASGLSIGILNTIVFLGVAASQQVVGFLLEYHSGPLSKNNASNLLLADFQFAFTSLIIFMVISFIASALIKELPLRSS
jgi:MFS family permease